MPVLPPAGCRRDVVLQHHAEDQDGLDRSIYSRQHPPSPVDRASGLLTGRTRTGSIQDGRKRICSFSPAFYGSLQDPSKCARSMMPLSKADPKLQYNSLPNPSVRYQHSTRRLPSCSSTSGSSGTAELLLGGPALKNLLHQSSSVYSQRGPAVTGRTDGTSSAYSSPRIPKREAPRSKDTLDLRTDSLTQRALRDLQLRRNTNKNWTFGKYRQRNVDNADSSEKAGRTGMWCLWMEWG
ncbi:uncharacterized protein LOC133643107 [Entelurus aequoreus]|uniref:uncharacterized protein LOC133643107 n=1 Tax=Entelurus aequoreus TaxID=161455 RepID=UPI002B1E837E|nr:uncharacterized protein LOC133643107 [Entelurus aequoreus]